MKPMEGFFGTLLIIGLALTAGVLLIGVASFALGGDFNRKHSNNLMRLRVILQGIVIAVFVIAMLLLGR